MPKLIVIGGVAAGMSAAAEAKRSNPLLEVDVYEKGPHISYGACGLPYFIGNPAQKPNELIAVTPQEALEKKGVNVYVNYEVTSIDTRNKTVRVNDLVTGMSSEHAYEKLIIATGAVPFVPDIPGADSQLLFRLRTLTDGIKLKAFICGNKPDKAVIIGDGHIALEVAENFKACGIGRITIIARNRHLCWWLDEDIARLQAEEAQKNGIELIFGERITGITTGTNAITVTTDKASYSAAFGLISCGMKPNSTLASAAGIAVDNRGAIIVDSRMRTSEADVYAAGDCCTTFFVPEQRDIYMPRGTTANRQGRTAGYNSAGIDAEYKGTAGAMVFKLFGIETGRTGMTDAMAAARKMEFVSVLIKSRNKAGYYPGSERIYVKLTAEKGTGKLLGGQITGAEGSAKRIDTVSLAIMQGMTVKQFKDTDMAYAPPFSPVWDPVLIAANKLAKLV